LVPSPAIDRLIFDRADHAAIERTAIDDGMRPMLDSGLLAVIQGETTLEEVLRSVHTDL
jgi:general secretion pathway protein E